MNINESLLPAKKEFAKIVEAWTYASLLNNGYTPPTELTQEWLDEKSLRLLQFTGKFPEEFCFEIHRVSVVPGDNGEPKVTHTLLADAVISINVKHE